MEKYYERNVKFARAEDEMRISLENTIRCRPPIHAIHRENRAIEVLPTASSISKRRQRTLKSPSNGQQACDNDSTSIGLPVIRIKRLTPIEIEMALNGDFSTWVNTLPADVAINKNRINRYNLRKRK